jgi:hypothetical protein
VYTLDMARAHIRELHRAADDARRNAPVSTRRARRRHRAR